jgi:hypothetical protein
MKGFLKFLVAPVALACALIGCVNHVSRPSCTTLKNRAAEAQAAVKVCQAIPGCQLHLDDIISVREKQKAANRCEAMEQ